MTTVALLIAALICFALAVPPLAVRINLVALGLVFVTLSALITVWPAR